MQAHLQALHLPLRHPFTLGNGSSRTHTAIALLRLEMENSSGYGEAAMPPYLPENQETIRDFYQKIDLRKIKYPFDFETIHADLNRQVPGNTMAKAALDIALHDIWGKRERKALFELLRTNPLQTKETACTIGIADPELIQQKTKEAADFKYLKIKLGAPNDKELIQTIRTCTNKALYTDVNGGWTDREYALDMAYWLQEQGVSILEQPFEKSRIGDLAWLKARSPIPIFADESCQNLDDIPKMVDSVDGINIKLMKCGGIYPAMGLFQAAKAAGLKTLLGCMTETSCATYAALSIAALADYVDIDGPWMLAEQPFERPALEAGQLLCSKEPGLGLRQIAKNAT